METLSLPFYLINSFKAALESLVDKNNYRAGNKNYIISNIISSIISTPEPKMYPSNRLFLINAIQNFEVIALYYRLVTVITA